MVDTESTKGGVDDVSGVPSTKIILRRVVVKLAHLSRYTHTESSEQYGTFQIGYYNFCGGVGGVHTSLFTLVYSQMFNFQ